MLFSKPLTPSAVVLALVIAVAPAYAQINNFELHLSGKPVGTDTFTLNKSKQGYKLSGHLKGAIKNNELDFKEDMAFSDSYMFMEGSLTSQDTNQQTSYLPSKDHKEMTIAFAASGKTSSRFEPIDGANLALLPPFDAGAAQALLLMAVTHPTPDNLYNIYLTPGYSLGSSRGSAPDPAAPPSAPEETLPPGVNCFKALWAKGRDVTGTLDDKPVSLHTYQLAFGRFRWIFFADDANTLMQVNVSLLHGSYIRSRFKLDPIK